MNSTTAGLILEMVSYTSRSAPRVRLTMCPAGSRAKEFAWPAMVTALRMSAALTVIFEYWRGRRGALGTTHGCAATSAREMRDPASLFRSRARRSARPESSRSGILTGSSAQTAVTSSSCDDTSKGVWPNTMTKRLTPRDQMSAVLPRYCVSPQTSGARYMGVPGEPEVRSSSSLARVSSASIRETPKSAMMPLRSEETRTLSGLRSKCTTFWKCR
mmetsp:Transcript_26132/g.87501  ORF Transcript_26132/g.87501 Transcript_26132/m.87501 type:complete len:216 (-) Transcript_26132:343-990(-)